MITKVKQVSVLTLYVYVLQNQLRNLLLDTKVLNYSNSKQCIVVVHMKSILMYNYFNQLLLFFAFQCSCSYFIALARLPSLLW